MEHHGSHKMVNTKVGVSATWISRLKELLQLRDGSPSPGLGQTGNDNQAGNLVVCLGLLKMCVYLVGGLEHFFPYMEVSINGGYPKMIHFGRSAPYKPAIVGYPQFRKPPYWEEWSQLTICYFSEGVKAATSCVPIVVAVPTRNMGNPLGRGAIFVAPLLQIHDHHSRFKRFTRELRVGSGIPQEGTILRVLICINN